MCHSVIYQLNLVGKSRLKIYAKKEKFSWDKSLIKVDGGNTGSF